MSSLRISSLVAWFLLHASVSAQTWQSLASQMSGTPAGVGPQPQGSNTWLAATGTNAYRSTDNGLTWTIANTGLLDPGNGITLANFFFKTPTGRILRGGDNSSWNNRIGSPLWYSDDEGLTWSESLLPFGSVATNPAGIGFTAFTVHGGAIYAADQLSQGVWKSTDNGLTWTAARNGIPTTLNFPFQATVLSSVTSNANAVFATGIATGIHRSTDGGANWSYVGNGLGGAGARDIVVLNNGTLFARVNDNSLFRSTDNGDSWINVSQSLGQGNITSVATDGTRVFAFTSTQKLLESTDGGNTFSIVNGGTPPPLRTSNKRQLAVNANTALYSSDTAFWRLDLATAPRLAFAPTVITPPVGKGVNVGGSVTLSVVHSAATQPLTYQWKLGGSNIPGANDPTYTLSSATLGDAGSYTVEISNASLPGGGTTVSAAATVIVAPTTPGSIDYTIQPISTAQQFGTGYDVRSVFAASDGSVWFGGGFRTPSQSLARLRPDGTVDTAFAPTTNLNGSETVLAAHPLSDGSVIAGGGDTAGGSSYLRKLRPDGSVDTAFASPVELVGTTFGIQPGPGDTCYVAGSYGIYRISTVTGEIDFTFNPPRVDNIVRSFAVAQDGKITIAGDFGYVNTIVRPRIARLHPDGTLDMSFDTGATSSGFNGNLTGVAVQKDGKIVATGAFTSYRGTTIARVARLLSTGEIDPSFTPPLFDPSQDGRVLALTLDGEDRIILGGVFTWVNSTTRNNIIRLNLNGTLDTTFPSRPDALTINTLATQPDGKILVGTVISFYRLLGVAPVHPSVATFTQDISVAAGQPASFTVSFAGPSTGATYEWFKDGVLLPAPSSATLQIPSVSVSDIGRYHVRATIGTTVLESDSSRLDLSGAPYFIRQPSTATGYLGYPHLLAAQVAGTGPVTYQWFKNDSAIPGATGGGLSFAALAAADAATYFVRATAPTGSIDSTPFYLKVLPRRGTVDSTFRFNPASIGFSNAANSFLSLPNGYHLIGGPFTSTADGSRSLFRLFPDGTIDPSFNSSPLNVTGVVRWLFRQPDGKIIVGSDVRPIRLNEDLTLDTSFSFPELNTSIGAIQAMTLLSNGGLLVQGFSSTNVPGYPSKFFRTTPSGAIDTTFPAIALLPTASVTALSEDSSGRLLIAGSFTQVAGQPRERVARLSAAGVLDATFIGPGIFNNSFNNFIPMKFITQGPDSSVFLGGDGITNIGAAPAGRVVKLHPTTGAHDPTFYPSAFSGTANAIRFLPNGKLALAGNFIADIQNFSPFYTFYEVLYPNGARDRRELGPISSSSATSFFPSSPGTDIFLGSFTVPGYSPSSAVRFFTGDVDFGILSQTAITASNPAVPSGTPADTVIVGTNVTLGVSILGSSTVTYQWHFNGDPIPGATSDTLTRNPVLKTHEGTYTVVATNASGTVTTKQLYLDVRAEPEIVTAPQSVSRAIGQTVSLTVSAVGAGTLSYRWTKGGTDLADGGAISGSGTATLTITNAQEADSGVYAVRVTNFVASTTSATAVVNVVLQPGSLNAAWAPAAPDGTVQKVLVRSDGRLLITSAASGGFTTVGGTSRPTVALLNEDGTLNTTFASTQPFTSGYTIRRFVLGPDGLTPYAAVSNGTTSSIFRYGADGQYTTLLTITNGAIYDLVVEAPERITYVGNFPARVARINIQGTVATADTTFVPPTFNDGVAYSVARRLSGGYVIGGSFSTINGSAYSRVIKISDQGALDTSFRPTINITVPTWAYLREIDGGKVFFGGVRLLPTGAADPAWNSLFNPNNWATTVTDMTLTIEGKLIVVGTFTTVSGQSRRGIVRLTDTGALDADFTSPTSLTGSLVGVGLGVNGRLYAGGSVTAYNGTTVNRLVRINHEPTDIAFVAQPQPLATNLDGSATFTAQAFGSSALTYRWLKDGTPLSEGGRFSGTATPSLTITPVTRGDAGTFRVEITNLAGTRLSLPAALTVLAEPTLVTSPAGGILPVGTNTSLAASFTGATPLTYSWTRDGNPVSNGGRFSGATTATLTITGITLDDAGAYVATASNTFGSIQTQPAAISVIIPPASLDLSIPASLGANNAVTGLVPLPDGRFLVGGSFTSIGGQSRSYLAVLNANGTVDTSFTPPTMNGTVTRLFGLLDGSVIVAGSFATVAADTTNYRYVYKLTPALALDATFRPAINSPINAVIEESTGTLLLGGSFTSVGGVTTHPYLARVNATTGAFETSLRAKVNSSVLALLADGTGRTYVGGVFTASGTDSVSSGPAYLARIAADGTLDSWAPGANNTVYALARDGSGRILAGGDFTSFSGGTTVSRTRLARFLADGTIDPDFNPAPSGSVRSIAVQDNGSILISGAFSTVSGTASTRLARLLPSGSLDPAFEIGDGLGGSSTHYSDPIVIQPDGRIWLMGLFTTYKGTAVTYLVRLNGDPVNLAISRDLPAVLIVQPGAAISLPSGATGTSAISYAWTRESAPVADGGRVSGATTGSLQITGAVVADSGFYRMTATNASGSRQTRLAQVIVLDAPVITRQPAGATVATATTLTLRVEALGAGTVSYQWRRNGTPLENSARITGVATNTLTITGLLIADSGNYTAVASNTLGSAASEVAAITVFAPPAGIDPAFNPAFAAGNVVYAVAAESSGSVLIGGAFLGGQPRLARILPNGTRDSAFAPTPNAPVTQITPLADGKVFVSGGFSQIAGASRVYLARLNAVGTLDTTFTPPTTGTIYSHVVFPDGRVMIAGNFSTVGGVARAGFARLNVNGTLDTSFVPTGTSGAGRAILPLADGGFLLGFSSAPYLIKVGADGTKDTSFTLTASSTVTHLARRADGGVIVAGDFGAFNGVNRAFLAALLPDLSHDTNWGSAVALNSSISAVAVQANGKVLLGGSFTGNLRRLNADGTPDTAFTPGAFTFTLSPPVQSIAVTTLGPIWVGGQFTSYSGQRADYLVRLNGDTANPDPLGDFLTAAGVPANQRGPNDDADNDGLDNLLEYALDLNPNGSGGAFTGTPPAFSSTPSQLSYTYRRVRSDVTYIVETSPTLIGGTWTTVGVTQGTPGPDGTTTASIPVTPGSQFLRLSVAR